ncbi:MAG: 2'-5' RNA ligase family protein, partial [Eubacteriales bacterium]|nr:2'-5' RNA ligase family protein [Eubacteriales bacterium]
TKNLPYHISLGTYALSRRQQLIDCMQRACAGHDAFGLHFSGLGLFGLDVLFFAPVANEQLLALHRQFPAGDDAFVWTPHATLLIDEPDVIQRALPLVTGLYTNLTGCVDSLSLYEFWPLHHLVTCRLGAR